jgi:prophage regulatory protein
VSEAKSTTSQILLERPAPPSDEPRILERLPRVKARSGISRSEIYRRIARGTFPRPVKLGERASAWDSREIDAWIADRIAIRDLKGSA